MKEADVTYLESGYDYITIYFKCPTVLREASKRLYNYSKRANFEHYDMQRKNFSHLPGDVPHFHNGIDATLGPHLHILYPHRPTEEDWEELKVMLKSKLVNINLDDSTINEEIC